MELHNLTHAIDTTVHKLGLNFQHEDNAQIDYTVITRKDDQKENIDMLCNALTIACVPF